MKLASLKSGRDGKLIVVSKDLAAACEATDIAPTMQAALDNWSQIAPRLEEVYHALNNGSAANAFAFHIENVAAPLPRAYQYLDGACYLSHIRRNRQARGDSLPEDLMDAPLVQT